MYEIKVRGILDDHWQDWFEGMNLELAENDNGGDCTLLIGAIADQPALYGLLEKVRDLNLVLVSVRRIPPKK